MKRLTAKRGLSALLAACMLLPVLSVRFPARAAGLRGDVNLDGRILAEDARLCLRCAVGLETFEKDSAPFFACDYNGDGAVTAADARSILRLAVGLNADDAAFRVPTQVYAGKRGTVTLTRWELAAGSDAAAPELKCAFTVQNLSDEAYTLGIEAITVNGLRLPDPALSGSRLKPNGSETLQIAIPGEYFELSGAGEPVVDELLALIRFTRETDGGSFHARIALYPTGKAPGAFSYSRRDARKYVRLKETAGFVFGLQGAAYDYALQIGGEKRVNNLDALFYFKNKSDRDLRILFSDIKINDTLRFPNGETLYVFAGTAAEPGIRIDPDFFSGNPCYGLKNLTYTVTVTDAKTDEILYSENRALKLG